MLGKQLQVKRLHHTAGQPTWYRCGGPALSLLLGNPELVLLPDTMLTVCSCDHTEEGLHQRVMCDTAALAESLTVVCPPWQQRPAAGVVAALAHMAVS